MSFVCQIDLQQVAQGIEQLNPPGDVFRSVAENAVHLSGSRSDFEDLVNELCGDEGLADVSVQMLKFVELSAFWSLISFPWKGKVEGP